MSRGIRRLRPWPARRAPVDDRFDAADDVLREALEAEARRRAADATGAGLLGRLLDNRDVAILIVAIVLFALFALLGPRFLSENNLIDIARRAAILGILAVGMTYLFVAGELDLSIGSHYGFPADPDVVPGGAARRSIRGSRPAS